MRPGHCDESLRWFSNTGEGGEDAERFKKDPNGDWRRSRIKQWPRAVSGDDRIFGQRDQLQIKMAQGAKPGEAASFPVTRCPRKLRLPVIPRPE